MLTPSEARILSVCIDNVQVSHLADPDWTNARSGLRKLREIADGEQPPASASYPDNDDALHRAVGGSE